jgi:hypothetical protein
LALASVVVWRACSALVISAREDLTSSSPIAIGARDVAEGGDAGAADAGGGDAERVDEDRRDRDTKLSRASVPNAAGPRLRSS